MNIEQYIADLEWSDDATDHEKTLVAGNLRTLYAAMMNDEKVLLRLLEDWASPLTDKAALRAKTLTILHGCSRCGGSGWLDPIEGWRDGSYVTSRPCPECNSGGGLQL